MNYRGFWGNQNIIFIGVENIFMCFIKLRRIFNNSEDSDDFEKKIYNNWEFRKN